MQRSKFVSSLLYSAEIQKKAPNATNRGKG